ncbi:TolC family protein [Spirosoma sp. KCTC 42546]|uniref:TolC family protein n=1 Tax=Spirosoma sp. KCTC 42546 TaxID=2520506 RepID=UPI001FEDB035|nr:TolC family protein [Spirosoma sp. KCTC 42546]
MKVLRHPDSMKTTIANRFSHLILPFAWVLTLWAVGYGVSYGQGAVPPKPATTQPLATSVAASPVDSLTFDFNQDISVQLIPFDEMFKIALAYSPAVRFESALATAQQAAYQLSKLQLFQNIGGFANYSSGNQAILSTGTNTSDQLGQISNGYRYGVNLSFSIHNIIARPQEIRLAKATYEANKERSRTAEIQLKRDLFNLYQDLLLSQRVLQIRLRDDQSSLAAYRIAEVEMQKGKITPEAAANNSSRYAESRTTVEQAKTQFIKNIYALELAVGVPIRQLKRQ